VELVKAYARVKYTKSMIKEFAQYLEKNREFQGNSKTARRCRKEGYEKGICAMMDRWISIQEVNGANSLYFM
jgi:hypothetical protein